MSGRATEQASPFEAMREMMNRMAYLALCYAIEGQRERAEGTRRTARELRRECADR
jgi:hypothetical protein